MKIIFLWSFIFLSACSWRERPLQVNLVSEVVDLDWNRAVDANSALVIENLMEGLTSYSDAVKQEFAGQIRPAPALAKSWTLSEGGKRYLFHLRSQVLWSDGEALTAKHFVDSWRRLLDPVTKSQNAYHLFDIEGAEAFATGRMNDFSRVGIKALDEHTLEVKLRQPVPYFLHLVASVNTFPLRIDLIDRFGDAWTEPENLVVLGPYTLKTWVHGERMEFVHNPLYWGEKPSIAKVIGRMVSEPVTALALYENGSLDLLPRDLSSQFLPTLMQRAEYRSGPKLTVSYIAFNTRKAPFRSAENRRNFAKLIDRMSLAKLSPGNQSPFQAWIPPGLLGFQPELGVPYDPSAKLPKNLGSLLLRFSGSDAWNLVFENLRGRLLEKNAVNLKLDSVDPRDFGKFLAELNLMRKGSAENSPHLIHLGWSADFPDPQSFMNVFTSTSDSNFTGWRNERYDALVRAASVAENEAERTQLYSEAQKILLEQEAVIIPLFTTSHQALVKKELSGVVLNPLDKWYFKNYRFQDRGN